MRSLLSVQPQPLLESSCLEFLNSCQSALTGHNTSTPELLGILKEGIRWAFDDVDNRLPFLGWGLASFITKVGGSICLCPLDLTYPGIQPTPSDAADCGFGALDLTNITTVTHSAPRCAVCLMHKYHRDRQ